VGQAGDEEQPLPSVGRSDVGRLEAGSFHLVTELVEPGDNDVQAPPNESSDVFDDDRPRPELFDDAEVLEPQSTSGSFEAGSFAGEADVLAREAPAQHVDPREIGSTNCSDIFEPLGVGPVLGEDGTAERVELDLEEDGSKSCLLQTFFEAAHSRE
jgi:hypothetical protein